MIKNNLIFFLRFIGGDRRKTFKGIFLHVTLQDASMGKKGGDFLAFIYIYKQAITRVHFPPLDFPNICPFSGHLKRNQEYSV